MLFVDHSSGLFFVVVVASLTPKNGQRTDPRKRETYADDDGEIRKREKDRQRMSV